MFGNPQRKLLGNEIGTNTIIFNINLILTPCWEVPRYNCTQFRGGMKGREIVGTEISKSLFL